MNNIHEITLQQAVDMTTRYRANRPSNFAICETFDADAITKLASTEGYNFLRVYYGMKEDTSVHAILVAANSDGEDILPLDTETLADSSNGGLILEDGYRCPQDCPPSSPLNS